MSAIDLLVGYKVDVLNISLGPRLLAYEENHPLQVATRSAVNQGFPVVIAAGNRGPKPNTMQSLACAPWVISVGAADKNRKLLETSSRGTPNRISPTLIAPGADMPIVGTRDFDAGTSFATAYVSGMVLLTTKILTLLLSDMRRTADGDNFLLSLSIDRPVCGLIDSGIDPEALPRYEPNLYHGEKSIQVSHTDEQHLWHLAMQDFLQQQGITHQPNLTPELIKRVLTLAAIPMSDYEAHEVGAGYLDLSVLHQFFREFTPSRLVDVLYANQPLTSEAKLALQKLDLQLNNLWSDTYIDLFDNIFRQAVLFAVAKIM